MNLPDTLRRRLPRGLAALAVALPVLALASCGGDSVPGNAVAKVEDQTILKSTFDHWMRIAAISSRGPAGGDDALSGGRGNDRLNGGRGRNTYSGGAGNDTISAANRKRETVNCGSGRRGRASVDRNDRVRGCERVSRRR